MSSSIKSASTLNQRHKRQVKAISLKEGTPPICTVYHTNEENIVKGWQMAEETEGVETIFKALSDTTRLKIIFALYDADELCVCDLAQIAGVSLASASHHLRFLHSQGLVRFEKRGKFVYYALDDNHVRILLEQSFIHWQHKKEENI